MPEEATHSPHIRASAPESSVRKPILAVDFDGTLHAYTSGWKGADIVSDPPISGAMRFLTDASEKFEVHIYSSRSNQPGGIMAMYDWLSEELARYWIDQPDFGAKVLSRIKFPKDKPQAEVILDDRAVTFNGIYPDIDALLAFKPWNKK